MYSYYIFLSGEVMFCPKCGSEYISETTTCTDCGALLIESISGSEQNKYVEILETFNLADIAMIKSILINANIDFLFLGENFNNIEQLVQPARLAVHEDQVDEAKKILEDMEIRYFGIASNVDLVDEKE